MTKEEIIESKLNKLSRSKFRSSFSLSQRDIDYIEEVGLETIKNHAYDFVEKRLSNPQNFIDGKQTPMKGHPVFIAQHATACCCRGCLYKNHNIEKSHILTNSEKNFIVMLLLTWISKKREEWKHTKKSKEVL